MQSAAIQWNESQAKMVVFLTAGSYFIEMQLKYTKHNNNLVLKMVKMKVKIKCVGLLYFSQHSINGW